MCGRYVLKASTLELQQTFHLDEVPPRSARYNIAPLQAAPVILDAAPKRLALAQWGLLPPWAKDAKRAHQLINARAETVAEKPAFKALLRTHRCLVPADGFYEWKHEGGRGRPHFVHLPGGQLLALAGLWNRWRSPDGLEVDTFSIITTRTEGRLAWLHDRMPALLDAEGRQAWLAGPGVPVEHLQALLHPWAGEPLELTEVSTHVNSVQVDDARCLEPPATVQLALL